MLKPALVTNESQYLERFPSLDVTLVGEYVGAGAQHVVRRYSADKVVKYPRAKTWRDLFSALVSPSITPTVGQMERDIELCTKAFGNAVVEPRLEVDRTGNAYALVQPHLAIGDLEPRHLADVAVREELDQLIDANRRLILDHKLWFDFMGWNAGKILQFRPHLDNVSRRLDRESDEPQLAILDCSLFPTPSLSLRGIHAWVIQNVQKLNLRGYGLKM